MASPPTAPVRLPSTWLPGESLFSLCSRYHRLSGNVLASTTCRELFGHARQGSAHDLPGRIEHFARIAEHALGSATDIIYKHTLLPFYLPFARADLADSSVEAMAGLSVAGLKFKLGLPASRMGANHVLKACVDCMFKDAREWQTCYWHLEHQLPGVWACQRHGTWLVASDLKANGVRRFHWMLPTLAQLRPSRRRKPPGALCLSLGSCAVRLTGLPTGWHFDPTALRATYRSALHARSLTKGCGSLRLHDIGQQYAAHVAALEAVEELAALKYRPRSATTAVARLLYGPRSGIHPLRHLLLITWLFDSFDGFLESYRLTLERQPAEADAKAAATPPADADRTRVEFLRRVSHGQAVSTAARELELDPTTGMAWAASAGIAIPRRPKALQPGERKALIAGLRRGVSKERAAKAAGVSISTVTRVLRTEVGLQQQWHQARMAASGTDARRKWIRCLGVTRGRGVTAARRLQPAAYAWLYRHDHAWLRKHLGPAPAKRSPPSRTDWTARDRHLAAEVRRHARAVVPNNSGAPTRLWQLVQRLPELKRKLRQLHRMPLTQRAVREVTQRRTSLVRGLSVS